MSVTFREAVNQLDEASFHALYGPWDPMPPELLAGLLAECGARWIVAGGRAARAGARPAITGTPMSRSGRRTSRRSARSWAAGTSGRSMTARSSRCCRASTSPPECEELWVRREAGQPWRFELLLDRHSTDARMGIQTRRPGTAAVG